MKNFSTSVVELRQEFTDAIETHPYECGWADEAIFFVEVHEPEPNAVRLRVQVSADGIRWHDEGTVLDLTDTASNAVAPTHGASSLAAFARVAHFGGFLRLAGAAYDAGGRKTPATLTIRLTLKG